MQKKTKKKQKRHQPVFAVALGHLTDSSHIFPEQQLNVGLVVLGRQFEEALQHILGKGDQLLWREEASSHTEFLSKARMACLYRFGDVVPRCSPASMLLLYRVSSCSWVIQDLVENAEDRQLEEQGLHLQVDGQAVQHPSDAVVGVRRVFGVGF